jgi:PAS domain-containing protein
VSNYNTVGITNVLIVRTDGDGQWTVRYGNKRASEVLEQEPEAYVGQDFWASFDLRAGSDRSDFEDLILEQSDFSFVAKSYTDEGRKVWHSFTFRSGTMSQARSCSSICRCGLDVDLSLLDSAVRCLCFS